MSPLRCALLTFVVCVLLLLPAAGAAAQPPDPAGALKAALWAGPAGPRLPDFRQPPAGTDAAPAGDLHALADFGSRIVFQSYRDSNWEVYAANGDGSQQARLTNNPHPDLEPRLNRDAGRVVYGAQYRGERSIYTMNVNGSSQNRITFPEEVYHIQPAWSPDGRRIAYASNEVGNYEIYVMNADGSGQTRLTIDPGADSRPFWSPDGRQIGWVRFGETDNVIWVMNADGSNPHAITPALRFLSHPVWSPDGTKLGFDYDADGDYWNELALLNLSDAKLTTLYDPGGQLLDAWMGSFAPGGDGVVFSRVEYVVYNNTLYLYRTYVERLTTAGARTRLTSTGYDLYPDMQRWDQTPPQSHLAPLPAWYRSNEITLNVVSQDNGRIAGYDIQVKDGAAGAWIDAFLNLSPDAPRMPQVTFVGQYGHTYSFRIRARDEAGNAEAWPAQPDVTTTTYAWRVNALIRDARDRPAPLADIILDPPALLSIRGDSLGRAAAYSGDTYNVARAGHAGYGRSTPTRIGQDSHGDVDNHFMYLRPLDDLLINGNFEAGSLAGWTTTGETAMDSAGTDGNPYRGSHAVHLGTTWSLTPPEAISDPRGNVCCPVIAAGTDGRLHAVWKDHWAGHRLWYAQRSPSGVWSSPTVIPNAQFITFSTPILAASPDGGLNVFWQDHQQPAHMITLRPNGTWSEREELPALGGPVSVGVDNAGTLHVAVRALETTQVWYLNRSAVGAWSAPTVLSEAQEAQDGPGLALALDDTIYIGWAADTYWTGFFRARSPAGQWGPVTAIPTLIYGPPFAVDRRQTLHALGACVAEQVYRCYAQRRPDGTWLPLEVLTTMPYGVNNSSVLVQTTEDGTFYALFWDWSVMGNVFAGRLPDGTWLKPMFVGPADGGLGLGLTVVGNTPHVVSGYPVEGRERIFYQTAVMSSADAISSIAQQVTIPADAHALTLAFHYRLADAQRNLGAGLRVRVQPADAPAPTTAAMFLSNRGDWTHAYVGLDAWAGRSVTVSLEAFTPAGGRPVEVFLDEVTLGSWWTPAPHSIAPDFIPPRTPARITIRGENFAATPALYVNQTTPLTDVEFVDEHTLRATLPANLPAGRYDLWITNPGGQMSANLGALRIAGWLYLPVVMR